MAEALGYANPRKALTDHVDAEDKGVTKCYTLGGEQDMTIINESGLYSLVLPGTSPSDALRAPALVAVPCFCCAGRSPLAKSRPLPLLRFGCFVRRTRLSYAVPHA